MKLDWLTFDLLAEGKSLPKWKRTVGLAKVSGQLFVAAGLANEAESKVFLCTLYDGTPSVTHGEHHYVPAEWLAAEFPETKKLCEHLFAELVANGLVRSQQI